MESPPYLVKGDTILIIATARSKSKEIIEPSIARLKSWGLNVELGEHLYKRYHQFAGTDEERSNDLQWAIDHKTAKAIMVNGGGYGTLRIMDRVNFNRIKKYPKWFIGYSDVTIIHNRFHNLKIQSIHGAMAFQLECDKESTGSIKHLLFGEKLVYSIPVSPLNRIGITEAEIVGGNLSLLYASSGSIDMLDTTNKILFIEDVDEQLYHIDRMMLQLKRSNKLKKLKGLIVGGMSEMKDNAIAFGKSANDIIFEAVKEYDYPVCFNFPAGHIKKNMAIYFGRKSRLSVKNKKVSLVYL